MRNSIIVGAVAAILLVLAVAFSASAQESSKRGSHWGRLDFEERIRLSGQRKLAKEVNRIARQEFGGRVGGWASVLIKNQSYQTQTRTLWITITRINEKGWYRRIWQEESFQVELAPGTVFTWQRARYGRSYKVTVREVYGSRWEPLYDQAYVPTRETYGYTLVVPGRDETDWERDQRALQEQLNLLLVQRAVKRDKDPELDAQIEALRAQISQNQKG